MSMSSALGSFMSWQREHGGRHERLETTEEEHDAGAPSREVPTGASQDDEEEALQLQEEEEDDLQEVVLAGEEVPVLVRNTSITSGNTNRPDEESAEIADDDEDDSGGVRVRTRRTLSLVELEEERELARRRTSACVLLAVFVLFRLWIVAIQSENFLMVCLCLILTSWTARYIRYNREYEEELDQRIAAHWNTEGSETEEDDQRHADLRMLSFQAQLALAIMESQRQMMRGGFGHPDGEEQSVGVSDEVRQQWERYKHKKDDSLSYGSVASKPDLETGVADPEKPSCSICLCEYEDGETIVGLPCNHIYHEDCVMSWTSNHVRCPLCNFDLESSASTTTQEEAAVEVL